MTDFKKWFAARARNPDRITLEEAFNAGKQSAPTASAGGQTMTDSTHELLDRLEAADNERDELRARIEEMEKQEPVAQVGVHKTGGNAGIMWSARPLNEFDSLPLLREGTKLYALHGAQPAQMVVAYLDLGVGGYMDIGTDLTDEALAAIPKGRHMLGIVGTYGVEGYVQAQSAPSIPEGWLRAIDDALVSAHIGVVNSGDTYEQAKAKLDNLIGFHVDVATDPAVNGGWKLVPIEPTQEMSEAGVFAGGVYYDVVEAAYESMLAAAPEAKP